MDTTTPSTSLYLIPGRLSDVLALIQVLAYDKFAKRTDDGLTNQLRRSPLTADSWIDIGRQHPELFRVLEAERHHSGQDTVALIARFVQEPVAPEAPDEPPKSPPLSPDQTGKLMELAIQLHDREVQRRDRWKTVLLPVVVAIIAAGASVVAAVISASKSSDRSLTTQSTGSAESGRRAIGTR